MTVVNNNLKMIDLPVWEQLTNAPANSAAGVTLADDNERFIYTLFSATSFWRYDTRANCWQQLANPTGGTVGTGTTLRFSKQVGGQFNGEVHGSIYAVITSGVGAAVFNRYDIATNAWTLLSVTSLPATFGTDGKLCYPEPFYNGYVGGYHTNVVQTITASAQALANATSISVSALPIALPAGCILNFGTFAAPIFAVLTSSAAAAATSILVSPLVTTVPASATALYYNEMYLLGNNAVTVYRYSVNTNTWATTSANAGNPALAGVTAAPGAGMTVKWLPATDLSSLWCVRGANTSTIYKYNLNTNTWSTVTFHPATETFNTGTSFGVRTNASGQQQNFIIHKDVTNRVYEFIPSTLRLNPICNQFLLSQGAALVGDKSCVMRSPDGIEFYYLLLSTSSSFLRTAFF